MTRRLNSILVRLIGLLVLSSIPSAAWACREIDGVPDFNCDSYLVITIVGDSIVTGVGDTARHNFGGYVARLQEQYPHAIVLNLGYRGITSKQLLQTVTKALKTPKMPNLRTMLELSDFIIVDVGRNDFFARTSAKSTAANIFGLVSVVDSTFTQRGVELPFITVSTLIPTSRKTAQAKFVGQVNQYLLRLNSPRFPVLVRLDGFDKHFLGRDQLHPTSMGYEQIAMLVQQALYLNVIPRMLKLRPDADHDGIYDRYELIRFHTDPLLADTDGDGRSDGDELYLDLTDPLVPTVQSAGGALAPGG